MKITPFGDRILVKRVEPRKVSDEFGLLENVTAGGIFIPDVAAEKPQTGVVVALGSGRVDEEGNRQPIKLEIGETVIFGRAVGQDVEVEGETFTLLTLAEVVAVQD